jgi:hypothetical protein
MKLYCKFSSSHALGHLAIRRPEQLRPDLFISRVRWFLLEALESETKRDKASDKCPAKSRIPIAKP